MGNPGIQGPQGPAGISGFHGTKEFTLGPGAPTIAFAWRAPLDVTHVLVEMWGGGGGGGTIFGGGGGAYSRSVITVVPDTVYQVTVGGGGIAKIAFQQAAGPGDDSSVSLNGTNLIFAGGGHAPDFGEQSPNEAPGGNPDPSAATSRAGFSGGVTFGSPAFGASFCPGPEGNQTGKGGDLFGAGHPGYVLLTW